MSEQEKMAELSRRQFLKSTAGIALGAALGGVIPQLVNVGDGVFAIPASEGYLLVDTTECAGCSTCMAACSLAHIGKVNLSLARIQVIRNPLASFPDDITQQQCRQCAYPACVDACPTGALQADAENGNVRIVDERKCIGCMQCTEACPFPTARVQWNHEENHAQKCDLCADTPYWDGEGPACIAVCPASAIKYTKEIPTQYGKEGYKVDFFEEPAYRRGWKE